MLLVWGGKKYYSTYLFNFSLSGFLFAGVNHIYTTIIMGF